MDRPERQPPDVIEPSQEIAEFIKSHGLSSREGEIMHLLLSRVITAEEIGGVLRISPHTVNNHLQKLFEKTGTTNKTEVVAAFVRYVLQRLNHCKMFVKQPKVMVIDDDAELCETIGDFLRGHGTVVHVFNDPLKALAAVPELHLDFIVSDINMPNLNGVELLMQVRRIHRMLPMMIFMTGQPIHTIEKSLAVGAVGFVEKPVKLEKLLFTIMEHFIEGTFERSRLLRVDAKLSATVNQVHVLSTSNVGFGGAFLPFSETMKRADPKFKVGKTIELAFSLGEGGEPIRAEGEIVWRREVGSLGLLPGIGIKFVALDPESRATLEEFVRIRRITSFIPMGASEPGKD